MEFSALEIRQLRCRLGWSQAELARCLKLELATVIQLEQGLFALSDELRNKLMLIFHQAEGMAEKVHRRPIAEVIMRSKGITQIHDSDVDDDLDDPSSR